MIYDQWRTQSSVGFLLLFAGLVHLLCLNDNQPLDLHKLPSFAMLLYRKTINFQQKRDMCSRACIRTCWSIPLTVGVFHRMTVRLHFPRRSASKVRLWSLLVPGMPLTRVIQRLGLQAMGAQALYALNALMPSTEISTALRINQVNIFKFVTRLKFFPIICVIIDNQEGGE